MSGVKRWAFCEEIDGIPFSFEEVLLEREGKPFGCVHLSEIMDRAWRHEDQGVRFDGEMIKVQVE